MSRCIAWCFTLNNWTQEELAAIVQLGQDASQVEYLVVGREHAPTTGTPHLQGYIRFVERKRLSALRSLISPRAAFFLARGTPQEASEYCKKENDFEEYGQLPELRPGKRTDWERLKLHIDELGERPTGRSLRVLFPGLMARYEHAVWSFIDAVLPPPVLTNSEPREGWQRDLVATLDGEPDNRTIEFVVDPIGGSGKTWFCQYMMTTRPDDVQYLRIGKRDDLCYAIDVSKKIFLVDVPRLQMEFLQYSVLEQIKDRLIFSAKYQSGLKVLPHPAFVIVFCNEYPNPNALSADRVHVHQVSYATVAG
jgi:hypothetical protein